MFGPWQQAAWWSNMQRGGHLSPAHVHSSDANELLQWCAIHFSLCSASYCGWVVCQSHCFSSAEHFLSLWLSVVPPHWRPCTCFDSCSSMHTASSMLIISLPPSFIGIYRRSTSALGSRLLYIVIIFLIFLLQAHLFSPVANASHVMHANVASQHSLKWPEWTLAVACNPHVSSGKQGHPTRVDNCAK